MRRPSMAVLANTHPTTRQLRQRLLAVLAVLALLVAACGADDESTSISDAADSGGFAADVASDDSEDFDDDAMEDEGRSSDVVTDGGSADSGNLAAQGDAEAPATTSGEGSGLGEGPEPLPQTAADLGRKIIFEATINVEVDNVAASEVEAKRIIADLGGFLFGQSTTGGSAAQSTLVFKVLPEDFNRALAGLGEIGELRSQSVTTDDVTERIVDISARIEVMELGVERLSTALENTSDFEEFARVENLLLNREAELAVLKGQLRTLEDRVDLSTITLVLGQDLLQNSVTLETTFYEGHDDGVGCPGEGNSSVETGSALTVCYEITNTGDLTLRDLQLVDTVLEIDENTPLIPIFGELAELAPGQSTVVAYEVTPERRVRPRTRVTGQPVEADTAESVGTRVSSINNYEINTFDPPEEPGLNDGFGNGFDTAVDILKALWKGLVAIVGFLIPMLVLLPIVWVLWKTWGAYRKRFPAQPKQIRGQPAPYYQSSAPPPADPPGNTVFQPPAPGRKTPKPDEAELPESE
ncbi:MAG: DUF4349 domain-containing protein [Acidimicrobiales bacterium]|nr:DUF4349 domain-containing protein [Acidimicrobiales bacterium]